MILIFLISLCSAVKFENEKDPVCMVFATGTARFRGEEVDKYASDHPELKRDALFQKLIEDSYYKCISHITDIEAMQIGFMRIKDYMKYEHLIYILLDKYKIPEDTQLSAQYMSMKKDLLKKITKISKLLRDDL